MDKLSRGEREGFRVRLTKKRVLTGFLILISLFIVVNLAILLSLDVGKNPSVCERCHIMESFYTSWSESSHREINCVVCHVEIGEFSILNFAQAYYTGRYNIPKTEVKTENCLLCHKDIFVRELHEKVAISHSVHVKENELKCIECHLGVVHRGEITNMLICDECHSKINIVTECESCHEKIHEWDVEFNDVVFKHSIHMEMKIKCEFCHNKREPEKSLIPQDEVSMENCGVCHDITTSSQENCERCHNLEKNKLFHTSENEKRCIECHKNVLEELKTWGDVSFSHENHLKRVRMCSSCHFKIIEKYTEVKMKMCGSCHSFNFENMKSCAQCHDVESFESCLLCHAEVGEKVLYVGSAKFEHSRHLEEDLTCRDCHFTILPLGERATAETCEQCHLHGG